jgi:hypothetical protein
MDFSCSFDLFFSDKRKGRILSSKDAASPDSTLKEGIKILLRALRTRLLQTYFERRE